MRKLHGAPGDAEAFALGTTLYIPANRADFMRGILRGSRPGAPSVTLCLEDSIREDEIGAGLENIRGFLAEIRRAGNGPRILIRPRRPEMLADPRLSGLADGIAGLVLPKFSAASLPGWLDALEILDAAGHGEEPGPPILPILETEDALDAAAMAALAQRLADPALRGRIPLLRVGGNDLQRILGVRREAGRTLYDGPLGYALKMLVSVFLPRGFALSAPVCEFLDGGSVLDGEAALDAAHGFCGKTAIHPAQLPAIVRAFRVTPEERAAALAILDAREAVFRLDGRMCEPATHRRWAERILARAEVHGISA